MHKAIEIKRRAQRFIQSGDLDGALAEYEKLVALEDCDPYNFVLLADLQFKRGDKPGSAERYLAATAAYQKSGLYKNAIAVLKKMMRLALSPTQVLARLAELHALDGLGTEASLYFQQYAELMVRARRHAEAADALRKAHETSPEEVRLLERVAEVWLVAENKSAAGLALAEAAFRYQQRGQADLAAACREKAESLHPGAVREYEAQYLLSSGAQPPAAEPEPPDEDEIESPGPPLLPSLRPADDEERDGIERFPRRGGAEPAPSRADLNGLSAEEIRRRGLLSAAEIEIVLQRAQEKLRAGEHDEAFRLLFVAAEAYEAVGRHDNAATIYRSLGKTPGTPIEVLRAWLANCERRGDKREAAQVACDLGDRAMTEGNPEEARRCFERARELDENNLLAQRRLQRMTEMLDGPGSGPVSTSAPDLDEEDLAPMLEPVLPEPSRPAQRGPSAPPPERPGAPPLSAPSGPDRVELAIGRSEAVSFDLGALLSEFQRGIESQLSGDAQGHYDLAMAYREMGLLDHAIESFRMALDHPGLAHRAAEMLGRCLLDQGRFDDAVQELSAALERPGMEGEAATSLHYLLGLGHEAAGRTREALAEFEHVFSQHSSYHDVALKLRDLRKALEAA